jgi:hypothetical protein
MLMGSINCGKRAKREILEGGSNGGRREKERTCGGSEGELLMMVPGMMVKVRPV